MTLLEALQLIGYSLGAMLPLWMGYLLFKQRLGVVAIQRLLLGLGVCMIGWHAGNLVVTLRSLFALDAAHWGTVLRVANTVAVISITVCYSLLLHVHIHLWASSQSRDSPTGDRARLPGYRRRSWPAPIPFLLAAGRKFHGLRAGEVRTQCLIDRAGPAQDLPLLRREVQLEE